MGWGVLNAAMLVGIAGAAVPLAIHFLSRSRVPIVDWGAMQFLDPGRKARRRVRLTEVLLMLARMALLALVALALARPYRAGNVSGAGLVGTGSGPARDVVIVVDGSASMGREAGGTSAKAGAIAAARGVVAGMRPGDSAGVLVAGDRVRPLVNPPSFDRARVDGALVGLGKSPGFGRGSSDIPGALAEAFRVLERSGNPAREVVVIWDGQRSAWRPGEASRWALLKDLQRRMPVPPRVWALAVGPAGKAELPNGSVGAVSLSRGLVTPGLPLTVSAVLENAGPGALSRTAELLVDGRVVPGSSREVGPVPEGGRAPLTFETALPAAGSHLLTVRLGGEGDALGADDEASAAVEVAAALPVLLVDGEPGNGPLEGEVDFLRAALAPTGDETPQVKATVVPAGKLDATALRGQAVVVLANVERLEADQAAAVSRFLENGGGVLVAPGDRTEAAAWNGLGWMPAKLQERKGDFGAKKAEAHPSPASFGGPVLPPFGKGDAPALGEANLFAYRVLEPTAGASVSARLDGGAPWVVEKTQGRGRVMVLAGPLDAEGGTLPVNPDFVPLVHEWAFHLAGGGEPKAVRPGEALTFKLDAAAAGLEGVSSLAVTTPGGETGRATVLRGAGGAGARFEDAAEAGVYRLTLPGAAGFAYAVVQGDGRESDPARLDAAEKTKLEEGWPLRFEKDAGALEAALADAPAGGRREVWRWLVLGALGGLCVEIYLTRRLVRAQGIV